MHVKSLGVMGMVRVRRLLVQGACLLLLAACSLPRGAALQSEILNETGAKNPSFQVVKVTRESAPRLAGWPVTGWSGGYRWFAASRGPDAALIQSGDRLELAVWESQENSLLAGAGSKMTALPAMMVSSGGAVFVPYVGEVAVRGLTETEARNRIQKELEDISVSSQVQISVVAGRNNSVDLVGGVGAPGRYPLEGRNESLLGVIAQGGGILPGLRNPLVRLQRNGQGYEVLARRLLETPDYNVRLRGGDQITVIEDTRSFNVLGAAGRQERIYFETEHMSAMDALSAMGGLDAGRANPRGILILRDFRADDLNPGGAGPEMQQVVFTIDLTGADGLFAARSFRVNPGDTLLATESPVNGARTILGLLGTVIGLGNAANDA